MDDRPRRDGLRPVDRQLGAACYRLSVRRCSDSSPVDIADLREALTRAEARRKGWAL